MMKKKIHKLIFGILSFTIGILNINAATAGQIDVVGHRGYETGLTFGGTNYNRYEFNFRGSNGQNGQAYCLDPGYTMNSNTNVTAYKAENQAAWKYLLNQDADPTVKQLAVHMFSVANGDAKSLTAEGKAVQDLLNGNSPFAGNTDLMNAARNLVSQALKYSDGPSGRVYLNRGSVTDVQGGKVINYKVTSTQNIENGDIQFWCDSRCSIRGASWNGNSGEVSVFVAEPECEYTFYATYKKMTSVNVDQSGGTPGTPDIPGTTTPGTTIPGTTYPGTPDTPGTTTPGTTIPGTTIPGTTIPGDQFPGSDGTVYILDPGKSDYQRMIVFIPGGTLPVPGSEGGSNPGTTIPGTTTPGTTIPGTTTPGTSGSDGITTPDTFIPGYTTPGTPGNNGTSWGIGVNVSRENSNTVYDEADFCPNNCNQPTEVKIPEYCDDDQDQEITITAPTDVKNCILKSKDDAGNTYQMLDGQVSQSNPYCSVYCKEDYSMTMPGAQYTTSGEYFKLKNTTVNAIRTCYATSARGSNQIGIDIDKFIADVKTKQEEVVKKYNEYNKAKALYEAKTATITQIAYSIQQKEYYESQGYSCSLISGSRYSCSKQGGVTQSTTTDCNGTSYTKYSLSYSWNTYTTSCDNTTGRCTVVSAGRQSETKSWGKSASKTESTSATETERLYDVGATEVTNWESQHPGFNCTNPNGDRNYVCTKNGTKSCSHTITDHGSEPSAPTASETNLTASVNSLKTSVGYMEQCYNWNNNICFNPETAFDYHEQYNSDIRFEQVGSTITNTTPATYSSNKNIDDAYTAEDAGNLKTINYLYCDSNGCNNSNAATTANNISTTDYYRKMTTTASAEYNNTQEFKTYYPHGTVETAPSGSSVQKPYEYLGAVFPAALKTPQGVYNWTLNFNNIGQYNNFPGCSNSALGRLNQVARVVNNQGISSDIKYVCVYVLDCPDCDFECECPPNNPDCNCEIPGCPDGDCDFDCIDCVFDGDDAFFYRIIDTGNINPQGRSLGANWTTDKANATIGALEGGAEYIIEMNPAQMKAIRSYNASTGDYVKENLNYHDLGGVTNAYGTSSFLDSGYVSVIARNTNWTLWPSIGDNIGPAWK